MRFWFDTEFYEDGEIIDLISIGVVAEDGRIYYAETPRAVELANRSQWLKENVLPHLKGAPIRSRETIASDLVEFMGENPEIWAYYAAYDWVALCQLFGRMVDLPKLWPMYCRDLKQSADEIGVCLPPQLLNQHNALGDALWTRDAWLHVAQWWPLKSKG